MTNFMWDSGSVSKKITLTNSQTKVMEVDTGDGDGRQPEAGQRKAGQRDSFLMAVLILSAPESG